MKLVAAGLALAALGQPVAAGTPVGWVRAASPDGLVSVATPCSAAQLERASVSGGWRIVCRHGDLELMATSGMPSAITGAITSFDDRLAAVRKSVDRSLQDETPIAGRRAFVVPCSDFEAAPCARFIDFRPARPLMLAVFKRNGAGNIRPAVKARQSILARQFYQSLEFSGK